MPGSARGSNVAGGTASPERSAARVDETARLLAPGGADFKVVILYQRLAGVGKAMAAYFHLMRELADDFIPDYRLWRIDAALAPEFAEEAEQDIAAARLLILAVNGHEPCPPAFHRWKGGATSEGNPPPRAIIALLEPGDGPTPVAESWSNVLPSVATQIHPEIFVCDPTIPSRGPGSTNPGRDPPPR